MPRTSKARRHHPSFRVESQEWRIAIRGARSGGVRTSGEDGRANPGSPSSESARESSPDGMPRTRKEPLGNRRPEASKDSSDARKSAFGKRNRSVARAPSPL